MEEFQELMAYLETKEIKVQQEHQEVRESKVLLV